MDAREILQAKYAAGELSKEELEERLRNLEALNEQVPVGSGADHRQVGFQDAFPLFVKNTLNFTGRSSRGAYWWMLVWALLLGFASGFLDAAIFGFEPEDPTPINTTLSILLILPNIALSVRRLHDVGKSGWWNLVGITIIGVIPLLYWAVQPGERSANRFGEDVEAGR